MDKFSYIKKIYNSSFSKYLPGFLRKKLLKDNQITFIPTKLKKLPDHNYPTEDSLHFQENLIKDYNNSGKISFNSFFDLKKILHEKFDQNLNFNFLDFGGDKIDLYLDITKDFKNINYYLINQKKINDIFKDIKKKHNFNNLVVIDDISEIKNYNYDFVFFGSSLQYLRNYEDVLSVILPKTKKFILFSATHFFSSKQLLKDIVVKQLNYLPKTYFLYFFNLENISNIFLSYNFKKDFDLLNKNFPSNFATFNDLNLENISYRNILFSKKTI